MIDRQEIEQMRQRAEHPTEPLQGALTVTNSDTYCDWCRGQGKDEHESALDETPEGTWVVRGQEGGIYHPSCAVRLQWLPTTKEMHTLTRYPKGPYA